MQRHTQFLSSFGMLMISLFISDSACSQNQFKHYSTEDGYAGPGTTKFAQDSLGFLWIKTGGGLYQFDGFNFTIKKANPKDSLHLSYDSGDDIFIDPQGQLWVIDRTSLRLYDRDINGFRTFNFKSLVSCLAFDWKEKVIWAGTHGDGLIQYNPSSRDTVRFKGNANDSLLSVRANQITSILDKGTYLLLGTVQGLLIFDKIAKTFSLPKGDIQYSSMLTSEIHKILRYRDFDWLLTPTGLFKIDTEFNVRDSFYFRDIINKFDYSKSFKTLSIAGVDLDAKGNFWIASRGLGLIHYNVETRVLKNYRHDATDPNSLLTDEIVDVMVDRDQNIWVSEFGKGISILKKQEADFYNPIPGVSANGIEVIKEGDSLRLIISTDLYGLVTASFHRGMRGMNNFKTSPIQARLAKYGECVRGKKFIWLSLLPQGVMGIPINPSNGVIEHGPVRIMEYNPENENTLSNSTASELWEDDHGNLWVGTLEGGLNKVNLSIPYGEKGSVTRFHHNVNDPNSINEGYWITALYPEDSLSLWVCTQTGIDLYRNNRFEHIAEISGAMCLIKTAKGQIIIGTKGGLYEGNLTRGQYHFAKIESLADSFITSIQEDKLGRLWIASLQGLYCYNPETKYLIMFEKEDGLQATRFSIAGTGSTQTPDGLMIFSGPNGLSVFDPMSFQISNSEPKPVITGLSVNNKKVTSGSSPYHEDDFQIPRHITSLDALELSYKQNIFSLEFSSMQLTSPKKNRYRYRLDGFDKEWIETDSKNRSATYTNLDPGKYIFRVKASNYNGIWNEKETTLTIHVLPPPWRAWWAYLVYSLILLSLLWLARRIIIQRERLTAKFDIERIELEKARELDRMKTSFFTNISHEFRTPLTLIKGPAQSLLEEFPTNPFVVRKTGMIQQNADHLLKLINQLLELSRMESNAATIEMTESDLGIFLNRIAQSFSSHAFQKKITYNVDISIQSIVAKVDKSKLEVIASNLISNALKFSEPGQSVAFKAAVVKNVEGYFQLILTVADTGIGIPSNELNRIFDRFYQVNTSHKEIGTGIGLALVKEFTQLLGGIVTVTSDVGKGSEFKVLMPIEILKSFDLASGAKLTSSNEWVDVAKEPNAPTRPKVLVVEDNYDLRNYIIESLGVEYDFLEAENGKTGLQLAISEIPEMIITDLMMPEMDGTVMTAEIKNDIRTSHIPVLMLTARATEEDKLAGLRLGADDYLTKPFNKTELVLKVKNSLAIREKLRARLKQEIETEASEPKMLSVDEQFLFNVKALIQKRISDEQLSVETLADSMSMSRVQLYRKVSALTGLSVIELIRIHRLQHAAKLLKKGNSVSQVAFEIGFSNHSHFGRLFKEKYGVLPSEYH